ncbi:MAG: glucan biosynthesis protein [Deltaproteobacteria bacterium]|nr:glucan biosynthesis protein [Deltaproteobacteria bacterium]
MRMKGRAQRAAQWLAAIGALAALTTAANRAWADFGLDDVAARAEHLAKQPFQDSKDKVPEWMLNMSYDQWRDIRFRTDKSLWRMDHLPFEAQFFHLGLYYARPVAVNVVDGTSIQHVPFSTDMFDYGKNTFAAAIPDDIGWAGFRLHYPIKNARYKDEVVVFLGASYFRALGRDQIYGLSARGLALDTVEPSGEEFPYFTEFWLVKPAANAKSLVVYALLDSRRVTGAYRFVVTPGAQTKVEVDSRLFFRDTVARVGIAPLTSMFFHGENTSRWFDDFRPEVHDSDGLLIFSSGGEWLWRPLDNPTSLQVSAFQLHDPQGFGLIQRDRDYEHYQDLEAHSELRPSAWIVPTDGWGAGDVELVELPTDTDIHDNIVAFWRPLSAPKEGDKLRFAYTLYWYGDDATRPPGGRVIATRRDRAASGTYRFVVDFGGKKLESLPGARPVRAVVTVASGAESAALIEQQVVKNPVNQTWRLTFQVQPKSTGPIELRAFLADDEETLSETWSNVVLQ